jgi:uncharacterized cupredoxin-like copper-binding protein
MARPPALPRIEDRRQYREGVVLHGRTTGDVDMFRLSTHAARGAGILAALALAGCTSAAAPSLTFNPVPVASAPSAAPTTAAPVITEAPTATPEVLGFTPGTAAAPRVVQISTNDLLQFTPAFVQVVKGETVSFKVHNVGKAVHEFMVGSLTDAFADKEGTPEVADIAGGDTKSITTTFDGDGPFAFACHAPGHYEHGMVGYIQLVGPGAPTIGTKDNPRLVLMNMDDALQFMPDSVTVAKGETIRFVLVNSGTVTHEFQVGPADLVAADKVDGVLNVEKDELDAGHTYSVDYTFSGDGPYAYACHEPGHYEAGMKGVVVIGQ